MQRLLLLQSSLPLIQTYGFTRTALAKSALSLHSDNNNYAHFSDTGDTTKARTDALAEANSEINTGTRTSTHIDSRLNHQTSAHTKIHEEELSDRAIDALFGKGDEARRTLVRAWMEEGRRKMRETTNDYGIRTNATENASGRAPLSALLKTRLRYNEPVLRHLPEAFALMLTPSSGITPIDPRPALLHAALIADEACFLSGAKGSESWYSKRATLAAIYTAAELHQLTSPQTAEPFLDDLLSSSTSVEYTLNEAVLFAEYFFKSWSGIIGSLGLR